MPADVTLSSGTGGGAIIATDPTTSSEHYQLIKLAQGAVGTFTLVTTANAFPVVTGSSFQGGITSLSSQITVTATGPVTVTSGTVTLSSVHTVTATGPVTVTSGLISVTSGTITSTAATNPWSSAPGFNVPTVSVSSGLSQVSAIQVSPTSSVAGAGLAVITSSFGLVTQSTQPVTITSGTITLSSQLTVTATGPVTVTSGLISVTSGTVTSTAATNPWSSAPGFNVPVVSVSSGLVQISGTPTVTATAATNPWSSAPGFNIPVVTVSSGFVRAFPVGAVTTSGLSAFHRMTTGGASVNVITTAASSLYGYAIFNSSAVPRSTKFYNSTAPTIGGSTANLILTVQAPGSTGGGGANLTLPIGLYSSNGWSCIITAGMGDTDTGAPGTNDISCGVFYQT